MKFYKNEHLVFSGSFCSRVSYRATTIMSW